MKMKIAVVTANMGSFDRPRPYTEQSVEYDRHHFTDKNFPPRLCSMTSRLQARIPKMFGWQMAPNYDVYIWVDCSYALSHQDSVKWFVESLGEGDLLLFRHPTRDTILQEADHIQERLDKGCPYITPRYQNELIKEQMAVIAADPNYVDDRLYASTALAYRNNKKVQEMMIQWWYHTSRFHSVDQLSLPYVAFKSGCQVKEVPLPRNSSSRINIPYMAKTRVPNG